jgi:hypothetical protein
MNLRERITMDPEICHGKPTVRGLRYTVESILELLSSGMAVEDFGPLRRLRTRGYSRRVRLRQATQPDKAH